MFELNIINKLRKPEDVFIKGKRLSDILAEHKLHAVIISGEDLSYIDFSNITLGLGTIMTNNNFTGSLFKNVKLQFCDLSGSNFTNVKFIDSYLIESHFSYCRFDLAIFENMIITDTNFKGSITDKCYYLDTYPLICPKEGSFIAWKVCTTYTETIDNPIEKDRYIVKLEIPEDAKRLSSTTKYGRCDKAKVLGIYGIYLCKDSFNKEVIDDPTQSIESIHAGTRIIKGDGKEKIVYTTYTTGEFVYPDSFDDDRWNLYTHGIHFYMNLEDIE